VSVANIRTLRGDAEVLELLGALLEEVRGLRADLRKQSPPAAVPMLLGALLSRLPEVEVVAEQRGASIYRLRRP
jgi:hypothetical protein